MRDEKAPIVIYATFETKEAAGAIARQIVEARLGACVNVLPSMTSYYLWEGKVENANEVVMIVKSIRLRQAALIEFIRRHHSYEEPAVLVLPVEGGSSSYIDWIRDCVNET